MVVIRVLGRLVPCVLIGFMFGALVGYHTVGIVVGAFVGLAMLAASALHAEPADETTHTQPVA